MFLSLRRMVIAAFVLLVVSSGIQGVIAIAGASSSARRVTTLERKSLIPAVGLSVLSQNLDQERDLLTADFPHLGRPERQAVSAELASLDLNISGTSRRVLLPQSRARWRSTWRQYQQWRAIYLREALGHASPGRLATARLRMSDRLNAVLDLVQEDAGIHLYQSANQYVQTLESDRMAIQSAVIGLIISLALGACLALAMIVRLSRGLGNLLTTAGRIEQGEVDVRAAESGGDEISALSRAFNRMMDALVRAEQRADSDGLTGLFNHRAFHDRLTTELERLHGDGARACLLMLDINDFKLFNDTYGHQVGDRALRDVAGLLQEECRSGDILARYGGDEFAVLLVDADEEAGRAYAVRVLSAARRKGIRVRTEDAPLPLNLSIGPAVIPDDGSQAAELIELADTRMFEAKRAGGGVWRKLPTLWIPRLRPESPLTLLDGLVTSIDNKDRYTRRHSEWVARFADALAEAMGWDDEQRQQLATAALIHDVGKIGIPDHILRKPDRLTAEETAFMRQHVALSELLVTQLAPPPDVIDAVRYHHERWDGQGYPYGLSEDDVPLIGRVMIVADAASAMFIDRPYRKGLTVPEIAEEFIRHRGTQFDPNLTDLFVSVLNAPTAQLTLAVSTERHVPATA